MRFQNRTAIVTGAASGIGKATVLRFAKEGAKVAVLDHMVERNGGRIINVTSIAAKVGIPKLAVYAASKGAIVSFTKSMAMELGPHNITVNCVSPGLVAHTEEVQPTNGTFLGRKGKPSEFASIIAFLASDEAAFVTGADYLADGGRTLGPRGV